jgi:hypothetical protein
VGPIAVAARVTEVDPAGELSDDEQVGPQDSVALQRARVEQRLARPDRPQVGEQPEALAQAEEPLLGPGLVRIGRVPLRPADGAEQHGVGLATCLENLVGERRAVLVDRGAADEILGDLEVAESIQHPPARRADLGTDAVAGKKDDPLRHRALSPRC